MRNLTTSCQVEQSSCNELDRQWPSCHSHVAECHWFAEASVILDVSNCMCDSHLDQIALCFTCARCLVRLPAQGNGCHDTSPCPRPRLKCDGTRAETRFRLSAKRTSPFKSAGGRQFSRLLAAEVCGISGSNAGYSMFRGSVKSTGYPLHSPVEM